MIPEQPLSPKVPLVLLSGFSTTATSATVRALRASGLTGGALDRPPMFAVAVPNALRNNEAQTNPPLPMGDTAFTAGGFDAFNRRTAPPGTPDFPELHPSIDRRELPPEWHGSDAYGWGGAGGGEGNAASIRSVATKKMLDTQLHTIIYIYIYTHSKNMF